MVSLATDGKWMNGGHEKVWKVREDVSTICEEGRGIEGEAKETHLESAKVLTGICLLSPSLSHLFWRNINVPMFLGDWPAGSLLGIL